MEKMTEMLERVSQEVQGKQNKTSSDLADQASKTYDKMLQYMEQIKIE